MAAKREHSDEMPDGHDEAHVEQLLKSAFAAPEISESFADSLSRELDRQFAQSCRSSQSATPGEAVSLNGVARAMPRDSSAETIPPEELGVSPSARSATTSRWSKLRLAVTLAAAASLLVAVSIWSSRPAYGWAAMMRALEECDWVQAVSAGGGLKEGWVSSARGILAVQSKAGVVFRNQREHTRSAYRTDEHVVHQEPINSAAAWNPSARLLALLMQNANQEQAEWDESTLELVSESWRKIEGNDRHGPLVELRVTLKVVAAEGRLVNAVFLIDPETNLPVEYREIGEDPDSSSEVEFAYPEQGPTTIYALGVPEDAEVVAATVSLPSDSAVEENDADAVALESTEKATAASVGEPTKDTPVPLPDEELLAQLNHQLADYWQSQGVHQAKPATDAEFLRRVYLDLTGRIPIVSEAYRFFEDQSEARREHLVDELLRSRDHATHLAAVWRGMLLPEEVDIRPLGGADKFDQWLADRFAGNLPYDQLASQLLLAEGRVSESGPLLFYAALKLNPEEIAAKTSRVFLGMRMECAQCHDHPFDDQITQVDFWGFAAFFAQISRPQGKMEMTSSVLRVHDSRQGEVTLPDSDDVIPPRLPEVAIAPSSTDSEEALSRRQQLVDWLASQQNDRFARAAVNRVWQHLFGRGLVEPADDMRAENEPVIPAALDLLSRDFAASGFDLRRLLRTLVLSDAYQLSSRAETDDPSQTLCFARMNIKSLTADQLYDCIAVATRNETMLAGNTPDGALARVNNSPREAFIAQFRAPAGQLTDYHAGIPQALTLMHGQLIHSATDLASSGLLKSLAAPFFSDEQRLETLFLATLSRLPEPAERAPMLAHVAAAESDAERQKALGDVLWALLNSAEFTFNH